MSVADVFKMRVVLPGQPRAARQGQQNGPVRAPRPREGDGSRPSRPAPPPAELERRRAELARRFAELQWDLGGIAYEMATRDHYRLDVLTRQAARIQEVDTELAAMERLLRLGEAGAAGTCPKCGAFYARGAAFCWQCGNQLMEEADNGGPARE